jgi:hypothetical protein
MCAAVEARLATCAKPRSLLVPQVSCMTNVIAFAVGTWTSLEALQSFSIFAAVGTLFVFIFQITLFPAFLVLDARREMRVRRNAGCCWGCTAPCCCAVGPKCCWHATRRAVRSRWSAPLLRPAAHAKRTPVRAWSLLGTMCAASSRRRSPWLTSSRAATMAGPPPRTSTSTRRRRLR